MSMLSILQHTIGCDRFGNRKGDRNHFVSGSSGSDLEHCITAVSLGLMKERTSEISSSLTGGESSRLFHVTKEGFDFVRINSEKAPKLTKSQERYKRYREFSDCFKTFLDFCYWDADNIRNGKYAR